MKLISSNFLAFALSLLTMTHAFSSPHHRATTSTSTTTSQLMMATSQQSRRDLLTTVVGTATASAAAALLVVPTAVEAKDAAPAATGVTGSQGVWFDPKHPDGYRTIRLAKGGKSYVMTLSDGVSKEEMLEEKVEKTYNDIPVKVNGNDNNLTIDFSFKGGPKDVVGVLSADGKKLTFPDGNTWVKNKYKFDGVYSVTDTTGKNIIPGQYRVLRQGKERKNKGFTTIVNVESVNDKDKWFFTKAKQQGSLLAIPTVDFTFYNLPTGGSGKEAKVEEEVIGSLYLVKRNTIAPYGTFVFPDGTRWSQL